MSEFCLIKVLFNCNGNRNCKKSNIGFSPEIGDMTHELLSRLSEKVDSEGIDVLKKRQSIYFQSVLIQIKENASR